MSSKGNHVAFVTLHRAGSGGSEMLWSQAARHLKSQGLRITVFHHVKPGVKNGLRLWEDVADSVSCLSSSKGFMRRVFEACRRMVANSEPETKFQAALHRLRPELVMINCGGHLAGSDLADICRALKQPYGVIIQVANDVDWPSDTCRESYKRMYLKSALNVFVSCHNLKVVETMLGLRLNNSVIIRNPCLLETKHHPLPWPKDISPVRMALPARLDIQDKGHDVLLHVLAQPQWLAREWTLNLYGQGRHEQGIRDLVHLLGLKHRVHFCGHVSDLADIWRNNHLLVMPSRAEGLPLALIEAMHAGRPSVVTDVGGNCELVMEGETGFVAEAPVIASISDTLERAWSAQNQWPEMGQRAWKKAKELWQKDPAKELAGQIKAALAEVPQT